MENRNATLILHKLAALVTESGHIEVKYCKELQEVLFPSTLKRIPKVLGERGCTVLIDCHYVHLYEYINKQCPSMEVTIKVYTLSKVPLCEGCDSLPPPHHQSWLMEACLCSTESSRRRSSAFVFYFSDWWNQTTGGLVLVDLVGHVGAHRLDLDVPGVGIIRFICKPFLFSACRETPCSCCCGFVGWKEGWSGRRSSSCWKNGRNGRSGKSSSGTGPHCGRTA